MAHTEHTTITPNQIVNQLLHIGHGNLDGYTPLGLMAAHHESELLAHTIAWNEPRGKIRDAKVALPVCALRGPYDAQLFENAAAHLALLSPRDLLRALSYHRGIGQPVTPGGGRWVKTAVRRYLREREAHPGWWDRTALQHRASLKSLYAQCHVRPNARAQAVLFDKLHPAGSVFHAVYHLRNMPPQEAAGTILNHRIPFLVAVGALGGIKDKPDVLLALIERMSGSELINNTVMLKRFGVMDSPVLAAAYNAGLERAKADGRVSDLKAGRAAQALGPGKAADKLQRVQAHKMAAGGIDGDWLVMGDKSGSMSKSIETSRHVAALLAQQVKGRVHLVFFDTHAYHMDVTGMTYAQIVEMTRRVQADGGTSMGVPLEYLAARGAAVNGIAVCSDGGHRHYTSFEAAYTAYCEQLGVHPTVYLFHVPGDPNYMVAGCERAGIPVQVFELGRTPDYYALPELVRVMRSDRFSLLDEILAVPLRTLDSVFVNQVQE